MANPRRRAAEVALEVRSVLGDTSSVGRERARRQPLEPGGAASVHGLALGTRSHPACDELIAAAAGARGPCAARRNSSPSSSSTTRADGTRASVSGHLPSWRGPVRPSRSPESPTELTVHEGGPTPSMLVRRSAASTVCKLRPSFGQNKGRMDSPPPTSQRRQTQWPPKPFESRTRSNGRLAVSERAGFVELGSQPLHHGALSTAIADVSAVGPGSDYEFRSIE